MGVSNIKSNPTGAVNWEFELGENLNAGEPIFIYSDSGSKVKKVYSSLANIATGERWYYTHCCLVAADKIVVAFRDMAVSNYLHVKCGTVNANETVTWGTKVQVATVQGQYVHVDRLSDNKFILTAKGTTGRIGAWVGDVSGTTITMGSEHDGSSGSAYDITNARIANNKFVMGWRNTSLSNHGYARVGSVAGTTITWGAMLEYGATASYENWVCNAGVDNKFAVFYRRASGTTRGFVRCSNVTGETIDGFGTEVECAAGYAYYMTGESIDANKTALMWRDGSDGNKGKMLVGTFSGGVGDTTPHFAPADIAIFNVATTYYPALTKMDTNDYIAAWTRYASPYRGELSRCTVSGTTITMTPVQTFQDGISYYNTIASISTDRYFMAWYSTTSASGKYIVVEDELNLLGYTSGLMQESGSLGETKKIDLLGGISEQLTGMTPGDHQYIQNDGSISEVVTDYHIGIALAADKMLIIKTE